MDLMSMLEKLLRHPRFVHFPVALFVIALGMELISRIFKKETFHGTAFHLYVLAAMSTVPTVLTGLWEAAQLNLHHPILDAHKRFAFLTLWTSLGGLLALWIFFKIKRSWFRFVFLILLILQVSLVSVAAYYGGRMVYEYGVGMEYSH